MARGRGEARGELARSRGSKGETSNRRRGGGKKKKNCSSSFRRSSFRPANVPIVSPFRAQNSNILLTLRAFYKFSHCCLGNLLKMTLGVDDLDIFSEI